VSMAMTEANPARSETAVEGGTERKVERTLALTPEIRAFAGRFVRISTTGMRDTRACEASRFDSFDAYDHPPEGW
jgi:hypothetical protein